MPRIVSSSFFWLRGNALLLHQVHRRTSGRCSTLGISRVHTHDILATEQRLTSAAAILLGASRPVARCDHCHGQRLPQRPTQLRAPAEPSRRILVALHLVVTSSSPLGVDLTRVTAHLSSRPMMPEPSAGPDRPRRRADPRGSSTEMFWIGL